MHRNIRLLTWFNFFLDLRFYSPVAILYFAEVTGSYVRGMSVFSVVMLASALFEVPTGIYSDMIGRKYTLVLGALASVLSVVSYALSGTYWHLIIGAISEGVARSFYSGNNEALLYDSLAETADQSLYAEFLGKTSASFQWALAIAALLGGLLADISLSLVMWVSVIPAIIGFVIALKVREPRVGKKQSTNIFAHLSAALVYFKTNARLRRLSLASILSYAQGEAGYQFRAVFIETLWPVWAIGLAKMLSNIGSALSFRYSGRILKKYSALPLLLIGKGYGLVSNTLATLFPTVASPLLLSSNSLFHGVTSVASSELRQREYSEAQRSTMASLNAFFGSIAFAIVAMGLGLVADRIGPASALLLLQILAGVAVYLYWDLFHRLKQG